MTTTIVNNSAGLVSALNAAKAGDVIQLAAGNYSSVTLSGLKYAGTVTVTSQDPNAMAVMNGLTVKGSDGLVFKGLDMNVNSTTEWSYQVLSSNNVTFDGVKVHGSLDGNASNDLSGLQIRSSTNVTVTNSEFQQLNNGIGHLDSSGLKITNNYIHDLSEDGIRGGGSSNVTVSGNYFTDFHRRQETDHPDAIQFWTTNTTSSASNITVTGNVVVRGAGDPIQGVFLRDQVGTLPYQNVTITNNLVVGGLRIGIGVYGGNHVNIADNTVAGLPDQQSQITTSRLENSTLTNNSSTAYAVTSGVETNDHTIASPTDGGAAIQHDYLAGLGRYSTTTVQSLSLQSIKTTSSMTSTVTTSTLVNGANITSTQLDAAANKAVAAMDAERAHAVHLDGTSADDKLASDGVHDTLITGGAGDDQLIGSAGVGHDTLVGGLGDDKFTVQTENDVVVEDANAGNDLVTAFVDYTLPDNVEQLRLAGDAREGVGNALANKINGGVGDDRLFGMGGDDQLSGGADGNDQLFGGDGNDMLNGNVGNDTLSGDAGDDKLSGDEGNDSLAGGAGADTVSGDAGNDTVSGGAGADVFMFRQGDVDAKGDTITDFSHAQGDRINLVAIDANTAVTGDQKFAFIGTSAFHHVAGELRFEVSSGVTHVYGDTNGDGVADIHLVMPGAGTLVAADFLL